MDSYMHFCHMFRMQLNTKKSKLLHISKTPDQNVSLTVQGATFESPKPPSTGVPCHRILGFMLDSNMEGWGHLSKLKRVAQNEMPILSHLAHTLGVDTALMHLEAVTTPKVLSSVEGVPPQIVQHPLHTLFAEAIARATLTHDGKDWRPGSIKLRMGPLVYESSQLDWDVLYEKQVIQLCGRLRAGAKLSNRGLAGSFAGEICKAKLAQSNPQVGLQNRLLDYGRALAAQWRVHPDTPPKCKVQQHADWKDKLYEGAWASVAQRRSATLLVEPPSRTSRQSNIGYIDKVLSGDKQGCLAAKAHEYVPHEHLQVASRRLLMGASPGLLGPSMRSLDQWGLVPDWKQADLVQCPCQCGISDGVHLLRECSRTDQVRDECRRALEGACSLPSDLQVLQGLSVQQREEHGLMGKLRFSPEVEKAVRLEVARLWAAELSRLRPVLRDDFAQAKSDMARHLSGRLHLDQPSSAD